MLGHKQSIALGLYKRRRCDSCAESRLFVAFYLYCSKPRVREGFFLYGMRESLLEISGSYQVDGDIVKHFFKRILKVHGLKYWIWDRW